MKLYKNVDLCDLESICENGILSANECDNFNWEDGNRANNTYDLVYLFEPTSDFNTFVKYGLVLLEVEVENAKKSEFVVGDVNKDKYNEYVVDRVLPNQITKIIIPFIFKEIIKEIISKEIFNKIIWCDTYYVETIENKSFYSGVNSPASVFKNDGNRFHKFAFNCGLITSLKYLYCYLDVPFKTETFNPFTQEKCVSHFEKVFYKIDFLKYCF